ncbi:hypothetical protein WG926_24135 [Tistrella sp. BH-R2-4]|uniref:Uncharacterized protein n=2 Tax=Geminicoccaceae TaxID=2066434 RepID=A0ABU9YRI1_9PROT
MRDEPNQTTTSLDAATVDDAARLPWSPPHARTANLRTAMFSGAGEPDGCFGS